MIAKRYLVAGAGRAQVWFRLFGVGLAWVDHRLHRPLFSERYSGQHGIPKRRRLHVGPWCFMVTTERRP